MLIRESGRLQYLISIPTEPTSETKPLLVFLHGYNEGAPAPIWEGVTAHGPLSRTASPMAQAGFVIVAPQLPEQGDFWYRYNEDVLTIVQQVSTFFRINAQQLFLTGFSFGANGVFDLALQEPRVWSALWPVDPTRVPVRHPGRPVWLSLGAASRHNEDAYVAVLRLQRLEDDSVSDLVYTDEGLDHVGTATHAYQDDRAYRWLLSKHSPPPQ